MREKYFRVVLSLFCDNYGYCLFFELECVLKCQEQVIRSNYFLAVLEFLISFYLIFHYSPHSLHEKNAPLISDSNFGSRFVRYYKGAGEGTRLNNGKGIR